MYQAGGIIAARMPMGLEHWGISTGCGTFISASMRRGIVVEEDIETFSGGNPIVSKGYPSNMLRHEVVAKARNFLGRKWDLLDYNCQHFATDCHNQKQSPQLKFALFCLAALGVAIFFSGGKTSTA